MKSGSPPSGCASRPGAAAPATTDLRKSRRFTRRGSERLEERNDCALGVVVEPALFGEVAGPEVVPLVDDEILALADLEHVAGKSQQRRAEVRIPLQLTNRAFDQPLQLLLVLLELRTSEVLAEDIDVGDQSDRHPLWEWADPDGTALAADERKEAPRRANERTQRRREIRFGHFEVAVHRDAIDDADAGSALVAEQRILRPPLRPQHLLDRLLERTHPGFYRRTPLEWPDGVVLEKRRRGPHADERRRDRLAAPAGGQRVVHLLAGQRVTDLDRAG